MYLVSHIFTVVMFSRSKMAKALLEQSNLDFFEVCRYHVSPFHRSMKSSRNLSKIISLFKLTCRYLITNNIYY